MYETRFPAPLEGRSVVGAERSVTIALLGIAERAACGAELIFRGHEGDYFLHIEDAVETFENVDNGGAAAAKVERDSWTDNVYMVTNRQGESSRTTVAKDGMHLMGEDAGMVMSMVAAVDGGQLQGTHRLTTVKHMEGVAGAVVLSIEITRHGDGRFFPTTAVDLRLVRSYNAGEGVIIQGRRIESDPNTGIVLLGDSLNGERVVEVEKDESVLYHSWSHITDPLPEMTAADLQGSHYSPTPVDGVIDSNTWIRLITQPLDPLDQL